MSSIDPLPQQRLATFYLRTVRPTDVSPLSTPNNRPSRNFVTDSTLPSLSALRARETRLFKTVSSQQSFVRAFRVSIVFQNFAFIKSERFN